MVIGLLVVAALLTLLMGPLLLGGVGVSTELLSALVAVLLISAAVSLVYWLAPAKDNSFRWITPGTGFFVVVWLLFSAGLSVYLSQFGTLNRVYGSLGAMIALLSWLYGSNLALLIGAELNAVLGKRLDPKVAQPASAL
jgi:membrane protein